ncbi:MAG TPA: SAM-dependent methyltransferase [Cellvibrio sp.]|nr:SAM-dependent methyltransferase [Cellvibrio sp.]
MRDISTVSLGKKIKLGKRLQQIESMVNEPYDHIWDCCCDHGLLGAALLSRQAAAHIHFVDIVPELMCELENKLKQFYPRIPESNSQWQLHCMDVATLPLTEFGGKHLVIIAGVGGDLMSELVKAIYQKNPLVDIDFLLCPVHHQFTLRQQLIQLDFSLKTETLMIENQRFYEILLVSTDNNLHAKIDPIGSLIWQSKTSEQAKIATDYLKKTLAHYHRMQLSRHADVQHIIDAYSNLRSPYGA